MIKKIFNKPYIIAEFLKDRYNLLPYYYKKTGFAHSPTTIFIAINSVCNLKCEMCDFGQQNENSLFYKNKEHLTEELNKLEEKIEWNPSSYIYNRSNLEHKAEKSGYRGKIELKKGGRKTNRLFVQWVASNNKKVVGTKIKIKIDNND